MAGNLRRRTGVKTTFIPNVSEPPSLPRPNVPQNHRINRSIKVISKAALEKTTENNRNLPSILSGDRGTLVIIITHLLLSTVFLAISEGWALLDALYFSVVIATTVGYGDITPIRPISKIFVAIYAIVSVAIIANLLQSLVERFAVAQRKMAKSARSIVLGISNDTLLQNSESTDLVVTSRLAVSRSVLRLRATMIMFLGACISGIVLYKYFLKESLVDVIYFLCISMTTVGLGDIHPKTQFGKAFATIWLVFTSLGFANILSQFADVKLKEREHETASKILSGNMSDKMFNEIDGDGDNTLSEAEYLGYIICKMGKSSPDDVSNDHDDHVYFFKKTMAHHVQSTY